MSSSKTFTNLCSCPWYYNTKITGEVHLWVRIEDIWSRKKKIIKVVSRTKPKLVLELHTTSGKYKVTMDKIMWGRCPTYAGQAYRNDLTRKLKTVTIQNKFAGEFLCVLCFLFVCLYVFCLFVCFFLFFCVCCYFS